PFHAFNRARKATLRAYEGVHETLRAINQCGCVIVAHTEATVPNALFRLSSLEIDQYLMRLYAIAPTGEGHPDPERAASAERPRDFVAYVSREHRKPNPELLTAICAEV